MASVHDEYSEEDSVQQPLRSNSQREEEFDDDEPIVHAATAAEKKRLWWRNAVINACFIASWFFFATVLSLYNKWMFSPDHFGFPYPLFVTTLHMIVQFVLAAILRLLFPQKFRPNQSPNLKDYSTKVAPTAVTTSLDIGLSNVSLKTITLSFYTMCKSSSLIFVLLFAFLFRLETFSLRLVGVILLIFAGVILMVATITDFVLPGFLLVMSASALGGLRWSLTQLLMMKKHMGLENPAATIYWLAPLMAITLAVISLIWEGWITVFGSSFFQDSVSTLRSMFFLLAPGVLAFCMVMSEFYIIQRAGVLPMSIAGIAKEVTTISVSAWVFGDELTPLNITGVAITVCGIALFTYHKYRKSIESPVALDALGNAIQVNRDVPRISIGSAHEYDFELNTADMHSVHTVRDAHYPSRQADDVTDIHHLLSADDIEEGEEDAEEFRSIRSSKLDWDAANRLDDADDHTVSESERGKLVK
ncbi:triose-phosphate transporter family-domain-containing protein [Hygrophoropsis aurantiaca]|uniref:Triose-phosphate transporter family-domain-containing protein n=1 Tax=Hygrophoropsis aurantiaca TaxID=72124 RepID=A0ACB8ASE6_9AGAM|nr:triose-phosphate transporter family-domain-containing protein [Hygrophoropsis aurantiaca]